MNLATLLENGLWAALFGTGLGVVLTTPARYLLATFLSAFLGRLVRDILMGWGVSQNWSTVVAAAVLVLVGGSIVRRHGAPPVVLICAVLPLGAAVAMFDTIIGLMVVSSAHGEALSAASVELIASAGKAVTGTLAIAAGLVMGFTVERLVKEVAVSLRGNA